MCVYMIVTVGSCIAPVCVCLISVAGGDSLLASGLYFTPQTTQRRRREGGGGDDKDEGGGGHLGDVLLDPASRVQSV